MEAEDILIELKELTPQDEITKNELIRILKKYASIISVYDLMMAAVHIRKDGEFIQTQYREKYIEIYIKYFIMRMKEVLESEKNSDSPINKQNFIDSFYLLEITFEN